MNPFQNLNLFQNANLAARFLIFAGLAVGIVEALKLSDSNSFTMPHQAGDMIILTIFIVIFNVKATIDDHHYFEQVWSSNVLLKYTGLVLAIFSWIFCGVAATLVDLPVHCVQMLGLSLLISTMWLGVHLIEIIIDPGRRNRQTVISLLRQKWAIINVLYIICFVVFLGWLNPVVPPYQAWTLGISLFILIIDTLTSYPIAGRTIT